MNDPSVPMVFVCGPMTHAHNGKGRDGELRRFLEMVHETLRRSGLDVASAHEVEGWGDDADGLSPEGIAQRDLDWMRASEAAVLVLGTPWQRDPWRTDGTFVELGWAIALDKLIVLVGNLDLYPSLLVQGVPSLSDRIRVVAPEAIQECPEFLLQQLDSLLRQPALTPSGVAAANQSSSPVGPGV